MKHDNPPPDVKDNEELTREELLDVLEMIMMDYKNQIGWNNGWEEAYQQLKKLIEDYDPDTAMWMDRCHEARIEIGKLKKQLDDEREYTKGYKVIQPKVSREDIQKLAEDIESVLDNIIPNSDAIAYSAVLVEHIGSWLKSKGIEIEK